METTVVPDPFRNDEELMRLRQRVIGTMRQRRAADPEELAQEALVRLYVNVHNGLEIRCVDAYLRQVGLNVLHEHRRHQFRHVPLSDNHAAPQPDTNREARGRWLTDRKAKRLSIQEASLLAAYYAADAGKQIAARRQLTAKLGITANALRLKVAKLRRKLR
jgi:DNA-directed RNA polymerase specialized sigma24 family protein